MTMTRKFAAGMISALLLGSSFSLPANAMTMRLLAVVEGEPITDGDVMERMHMEETISQRELELSNKQRKSALQQLVDDVIKRKEAKRLGLEIPDQAVDERIRAMSKQMKLSPEELGTKLDAAGVTMKALREQIRTNIAFRNILRRLYNIDVKVSDAEVQRRLQKIKSDPRLQPLKVYQLREVSLPLGATGAQTDQLAFARSIEAQGIMQKYRGCNSLRKASKGVFDVRISKVREAPEKALPPELLKAIRKAGTRKLIGPIRSKNSIQLFAYCGTRDIARPLPSKEVIKNVLLNEKFGRATERVMRKLRRSASIDFKVNEASLDKSKLKASPVAKQQPQSIGGQPVTGQAAQRGQASAYFQPQYGQQQQYQPQYGQQQYYQQQYAQPQYYQQQQYGQQQYYQQQYAQPQYYQQPNGQIVVRPAPQYGQPQYGQQQYYQQYYQQPQQ